MVPRAGLTAPYKPRKKVFRASNCRYHSAGSAKCQACAWSSTTDPTLPAPAEVPRHAPRRRSHLWGCEENADQGQHIALLAHDAYLCRVRLATAPA